MHIFTYLNKQKKIHKFLEKEISNIELLIDLNSKKLTNKDLINYSNSLFVFSHDKDKDSVIIN